MRHFSNPTENTAIGAVDKELRAMKKRAERLGLLCLMGRLTPRMEAEARREFVGIYRPMLEKYLAVARKYRWAASRR